MYYNDHYHNYNHKYDNDDHDNWWFRIERCLLH
jgi:hypothetical protein